MSRDMVLGVLTPFVGGWYFGGLLGGVTRAAALAGASTIVIQTLDAGTEQLEVGEMTSVAQPIAWRHVSGFIVLIGAASPAYLAGVRRAGKPIVAVSHDPGDLGCPVVLPDNRAGASQAVEHLIGHGHRRIAFAGHLAAADVRERYEAYLAVLAAHGIAADPRLLFEASDNLIEGGETVARNMLAAELPSTAVLAGTDDNAVAIMSVLTAAGCRLPSDQAVIGFDDSLAAAYVTPRLTSVNHPLDAIGRVAVERLLDEIAGGSTEPRRHCVPTTLVVRESCGCRGDRFEPTVPATAIPESATFPPIGATTPVNDSEPRRADAMDSPRTRLTRGLTGYLPFTTTAVAQADAVARGVEAIVATAGTTAGTTAGLGPAALPTDLRRPLERLFELLRPEHLVEVSNLIRTFGRHSAGIAERDNDAAAIWRIATCTQSIVLILAQTMARSLFDDANYLRATVSMQYEVSLDLLRSHEEDPQRLGWLASTSAVAGCLGLWSPGRSTVSPDSTLDIVGVFFGSHAEVPLSTLVPVSAFPPVELLAFIHERPGAAAFVVPVKVNASDWGLFAVVDSIESRVMTGREPINQWAALLAVALDHQAVLKALHVQEEQLRIAAQYDQLTGLPNRTLFLDRLGQAIRRTKRSGHLFAVLFIDLDAFKAVNDSLGHAAGDQLLIQVAERIQGMLRDVDTAARFGGDEFVLLLDAIEDVNSPSQVADRLHAVLSRAFHLSGHEIRISASIGIALGSARYERADDLLRDADIAMYAAKSHQPGSHAVFDAQMRAGVLRHKNTEAELRTALEHDQFEMYYQPIIGLGTRRLYGFEALLRWHHPSRDVLAPADFLAIAEKAGLIIPIGRWVCGEVCRQLAEWRAGDGPSDLSVSMNLSNAQFWKSGLIEDVEGALTLSNVDPRRVVFEITESVVMRDIARARKILDSLHDLGCPLQIDDFGKGNSPLEALHQLPIDALKLDPSFVSQLDTDPRGAELVRAVAVMAAQLGLDLIAKGIETESQRLRLIEIGCTYGQGYLLSEPVSADLAGCMLPRP